jgi:hypothetical protein
MFDNFLQMSEARGIHWQTLHSLLPRQSDSVPAAFIKQIQLEGREGTLAQQISENPQCA